VDADFAEQPLEAFILAPRRQNRSMALATPRRWKSGLTKNMSICRRYPDR